jgi:hypothetical protein
MVIVSLPRLCLQDVRDWLHRHGFGCPCSAVDRRLHGFLLARDGWGYVFLDGEDPEDEQRLSLAHELAHFLRHYWYPRREVCRKLGPGVLEVLDGRRRATDSERTQALLAAVPVGIHWHLLAHEEDGSLPRGTVSTAEEEADRLGYELLAPANEVQKRRGELLGEALVQSLRTEFGLPDAHARRYARLLVPCPSPDPLLRRLGVE